MKLTENHDSILREILDYLVKSVVISDMILW